MYLKYFFQLVRWKNLVLIALMQFLIKFYFLSNFEFATTLTYSLFYLLVFATICITASGYIINDIYDYKIDLINKSNKVIIEKYISIKSSKKLYFVLNTLGVILGAFLSFKINKPIYSLYFVIISAILFIYSKYLKGRVLIGNITVSLLLALSILIVLIFDKMHPINLKQINLTNTTQHIIIIYAIIAFLINLIREIVKDIEDVNGDYNNNLKTLPIIFGRKSAKNVAIFLGILSSLTFLFIVFNKLKIDTIVFGYIFLLIFSPLLYSIYLLNKAKKKKHYTKISTLLKIIIFTGVLSIPLISNYFLNV